MDKEKIKTILQKLDFVKWDRYFGKENLIFYGWIKRKDTHEDFVSIEFDNEGNYVTHGTSSSEYSKKISEILSAGHSECKRVEDFCDIPNVIKMDKIPIPKK